MLKCDFFFLSNQFKIQDPQNIFDFSHGCPGRFSHPKIPKLTEMTLNRSENILILKKSCQCIKLTNLTALSRDIFQVCSSFDNTSNFEIDLLVAEKFNFLSGGTSL